MYITDGEIDVLLCLKDKLSIIFMADKYKWTKSCV